ncbi:MAG: hypothetical protein FWC64_05985 [Treponema sp.]|nr:hypothetical protein [Treponema sp.]
MKNNFFFRAMLVMALAFAMAVTGCSNNNNNNRYTDYLDTLGLSTANPTAATLSPFGLETSEFNQIRDASGGGFRGWAIDELDGEGGEFVVMALIMAWTGRSLASFNYVADALEYILGEEIERFVEDGVHIAWGRDYSLIFHPSRIQEDGYFVSAGTMIVLIFPPNGEY